MQKINLLFTYITESTANLFSIGFDIVCFLFFIKYTQLLILSVMLTSYGLILTPINPIHILLVICLIKFIFNLNNNLSVKNQDRCNIFKNHEEVLNAKYLELCKTEKSDEILACIQEYKAILILDRLLSRAIYSMYKYAIVFVFIKIVLYFCGV